MVSVGYGDISPKSKVEKTVSIITILISCGVYAYTITFVGNIFS